MMVAMTVVGMVQVTLDDVVDVITVRHGLVPAIRSVRVIAPVTRAVVVGRAVGRIVTRHLEGVLVDVTVVRVMQMTVVQVVDVTIMRDRRVPAVGAMGVRVIRVPLTTHGMPPRKRHRET